jgi:glyoxylase-like metal-dependent hydrolase (beta-lactamase superfamily II)
MLCHMHDDHLVGVRIVYGVFGSNVFQHLNWVFFFKNSEPGTNLSKTRMMLEYGLNFEVKTVK